MQKLKWLACWMLPLALIGCSRFPHSEAQVQSAEPAAPALDIQSWQTDAGTRVLFVESHALPMLDVRLVFDAGSARDGDQPGLARLTSALIDQGAEGLSVDDIARGFEDRGAEVSMASYRDMGVISLRTLVEDDYRQPVLSLLGQVLSAPSFPQTALERIRTRMMQGLRREKQVPGPQVSKAFQATLYGQHPYGHPKNGTLQSLPEITRANLQAFYQRYYSAGNAVIAMVGDVERAQAEAIADTLSGALPAGPAAPTLPRAERLSERRIEHLPFASAQTHILLGNQATWRGNPDHVPLYVGNHILGGSGMTSMLMKEVRQERGYVYGISSYFQPMALGGPFQVRLQTANDNADQALSLTLSMLDDFVARGPTAEQVKQAKANILGGFALATADNSDIIGQLGAIGFYDLPLDYLQRFTQQVQQVTAEDIRAAFQRALDPASLAIVSIGPQAPGLASQHASRESDEKQGQNQ